MKHAGRCENCGYEIAPLNAMRPCPECGIDAWMRTELSLDVPRSARLASGWTVAGLVPALLLPALLAIGGLLAAAGVAPAAGIGWGNTPPIVHVISDLARYTTIVGLATTPPAIVTLVVLWSWMLRRRRRSRYCPWSIVIRPTAMIVLGGVLLIPVTNGLLPPPQAWMPL